MRGSWSALAVNEAVENVREVNEGGKRWLVAPAALIPNGVMAGSKGPLYYPEDESKNTAHLWHGVPITVQHPFDPATSSPLAANDDGVAERQHIGEVRTPSHSGGKTRAELWFDADATLRKSPDVYQALKRGEKIPLSTGLYTDNVPGAGHHNGTPYIATARNHRPDHLAVLPGGRGACHLDDGCGVNVTNSATCNCGGTYNSSGVCNECGAKATGEWAQSVWTDEARAASVAARAASRKAHEATKSGHESTAEKLGKHELGDSPGMKDIGKWNDSAVNSSKRGAFQAASTRHNHLAWMHDKVGESDKADLHRAAAEANSTAAKAIGHTGMKYNTDGAWEGSGSFGQQKSVEVLKSEAKLHRDAARACKAANDEDGFGRHTALADAAEMYAGGALMNSAATLSKKALETGLAKDHQAAADANRAAAAQAVKDGDGEKYLEHTQAAAEHESAATIPQTKNMWQKFWTFIGNADEPHHSPSDGKFISAKKVAGAHAKHGFDKAHGKDAGPGAGLENPNADKEPDEILDALGVPIKNPNAGKSHNAWGGKQKEVKQAAAGSADAAQRVAEFAAKVGNRKPSPKAESDVGDIEGPPDGDANCNRGISDKQREKMDPADFAGPDRSFPIETQADLDNACQSIGRAKDPDTVKAGIRRIAKRKGLKLPDAETWNCSCGGSCMRCSTINVWSDEARAASAAARALSKKADEATRKTGGPGSTSMKIGSKRISSREPGAYTASDHASHAELHEALAVHGGKFAAGHMEAAKAHREASEAATKVGRLTGEIKPGETGREALTRTHNYGATMNREQALAALTVNCSCDADRAALNNLSDETLVKLVGNKEFTSDEERKAAFAHMNAGGAESQNAMRHSAKAEKTGKAKHHEIAAAAHKEAAEHHREEGNTELAKAHSDAAKSHSMSAKHAQNAATANDLGPKNHKNKNVDKHDDKGQEQFDSEFDDDDDDYDSVDNSLTPSNLVRVVNQMAKIEQLTRGVKDPVKREKLVANLLTKPAAYIDEQLELMGTLNESAVARPAGFPALLPLFGSAPTPARPLGEQVDNAEGPVEPTIDYKATASPALVERLKQGA